MDNHPHEIEEIIKMKLFDRPYLCPECRVPLTKYPDPFIFLFCANGLCKSQKANDGAEGKTFDEAFLKLEKAILDEILKN